MALSIVSQDTGGRIWRGPRSLARLLRRTFAGPVWLLDLRRDGVFVEFTAFIGESHGHLVLAYPTVALLGIVGGPDVVDRALQECDLPGSLYLRNVEGIPVTVTPVNVRRRDLLGPRLRRLRRAALMAGLSNTDRPSLGRLRAVVRPETLEEYATPLASLAAAVAELLADQEPGALQHQQALWDSDDAFIRGAVGLPHLLERAQLLLANFKERSARSYLRQALHIEPSHPVALRDLAESYQREEKFIKEASCYRRLADAHPDYRDALRLPWAIASFRAGDFAACHSVLTGSVTDRGLAQYYQGLAADRLGESELAFLNVSVAAASKPDEPDILFDLARCAWRTRRYFTALGALWRIRRLKHLSSPDKPYCPLPDLPQSTSTLRHLFERAAA